MLRLYVALSDKENHHILEHYCTNLIEVLQSVMDRLLVRHSMCHIPEVKALQSIVDENQPVFLFSEQVESDNKRKSSEAEDYVVKDCH